MKASRAKDFGSHLSTPRCTRLQEQADERGLLYSARSQSRQESICRLRKVTHLRCRTRCAAGARSQASPGRNWASAVWLASPELLEWTKSEAGKTNRGSQRQTCAGTHTSTICVRQDRRHGLLLGCRPRLGGRSSLYLESLRLRLRLRGRLCSPRACGASGLSDCVKQRKHSSWALTLAPNAAELELRERLVLLLPTQALRSLLELFILTHGGGAGRQVNFAAVANFFVLSSRATRRRANPRSPAAARHSASRCPVAAMRGGAAAVAWKELPRHRTAAASAWLMRRSGRLSQRRLESSRRGRRRRRGPPEDFGDILVRKP